MSDSATLEVTLLSGFTTPIKSFAEMGVAGKVIGLSLIFSAHVVRPGHPPPDDLVSLDLYIGPGVAKTVVGTDSSGNIGVVATIAPITSKASTYAVAGTGNVILTPNGLGGLGFMAQLNVPNDEATDLVFDLSWIKTSAGDLTNNGSQGPPTDTTTGQNGTIHTEWNSPDPQDGTIVTETIDGIDTVEHWVPDGSFTFTNPDADPSLHQYVYCTQSVYGGIISDPDCGAPIGTPGSGCARLLPWTLVVTPNIGSIAGGAVVTIDGVDSSLLLRVNFGGDILTPTVVDSNTIQVVTNAHSAGVVDVTVYKPLTGEQVTAVGAFTFVNDTPTITSVTASTGPMEGGTTVTIAGFGFKPGSAVFFGSTPAASATYISPTEYQAVTPAHIVGPTDVLIFEP